jgi:hypothetical protein
MSKDQYNRNPKCHCLLCEPRVGTRGVTIYDVHHVDPSGAVWYIGDSVEKIQGEWVLSV